ncbi:Cell division cycle-associated protein 2 [Plecturocebus cupreus]
MNIHLPVSFSLHKGKRENDRPSGILTGRQGVQVLSSKCQRISYQRDFDENLRDAEGKAIDLQIFNVDTDRGCTVETSADLSEKSSKPELTETSNALKVDDCVAGKGSSDAISPDTFTAEGTSYFSVQKGPSLLQDLCTSLCSEEISVKMCLQSLQEHCNNLCDDGDGTRPSIISNLANCYKDREAEDEEKLEALAFLNMRKRNRVTFGEELSLEQILHCVKEEHVCKKDFSGLSSLMLEQSPVPEPIPQPDFDNKGENLENTEPPQVSFAVLSSSNKSSISETLLDTDTFSSSNYHEKTSSNRRNQLVSFVEESVCNLLNTEAQPCEEKKINRRKSQETKCTKRALPKNQVLKRCRKKKGKEKKSVQKFLYGRRDFASKKPLLNPIPKLPEVSEMTPSVPSV